MTNEEIKKMAVKATIFALVSASAMLFWSYSKHIVDTDAAGNDAEEDHGGAYTIEAAQDVSAEEENALTEDVAPETDFSDTSLEYERIVLVDVSRGGDDAGLVNGDISEKDIVLDTAFALKNTVEKNAEDNIKFYFTRLSDENVTYEEREKIIKNSQADLLVELSLSESEDTSVNGIRSFYNDSFFYEKLTNSAFADMVTKQCATCAAVEAEGVFACEKTDILMSSNIPSVNLSLGYISGDKDIRRLKDSSYQQRMCKGIYRAILEAFEVLE